MPNYMQYDPRTPRASAPRGIAPQNYAKQAMAGRSPYGQAPMPQGVIKPLGLSPGPGMPGYITKPNIIPMASPGGLAYAPGIGRPSARDLLQPMQQSTPSASEIPAVPMPPLPAPPVQLPAIPRAMPNGPVPSMPPGYQYQRPPVDLPVGPSNDIAPPFPGSPLARRGSFDAPLTPLAQMSPGEARAQVQSPYGVGTANGYVSRPGERVPFNQLMAGMSPQDRAIAAGDSGGPFGSLGGSSSRAAGLATLAQNMPQPPAAGGAPLPWNPALMAQVQAQRANPTTPQAIEQANLWRNAQRLNPAAPNYDPAYAARWNANRYGSQLGAAGIDTRGMTAEDIKSAARGVATSRAQTMAQNRANYFAQRSGRRVANPYGQAPMPFYGGAGGDRIKPGAIPGLAAIPNDATPEVRTQMISRNLDSVQNLPGPAALNALQQMGVSISDLEQIAQQGGGINTNPTLERQVAKVRQMLKMQPPQRPSQQSIRDQRIDAVGLGIL